MINTSDHGQKAWLQINQESLKMQVQHVLSQLGWTAEFCSAFPMGQADITFPPLVIVDHKVCKSVNEEVLDNPDILILVAYESAPEKETAHCHHLMPIFGESKASLKRQLAPILKQHERYWRLKKELHAHQKHLYEVEILKSAIVHNVSHELKTPLLQVKTAVTMLVDGVEESETLLKLAQTATARLESHVRNITMLSSSLDMNPGPLIIRDTVEYARRNLERTWESKNNVGRIQLQLESGLPPVLADKQNLAIVLQLLIDNALKFSDSDSEVTVIVKRRDEDAVTITVRDYGIGIPPEQLKLIFNIFHQVDGSTTRKYGGLGMGLTIVKLILDHHNTTIHVESKQGQGSSFSFNLPIYETF